METRTASMGSSPDDAALDWKGKVPDRTPGNEKQASSVLTFGGPTRPKKPVRRCFKSRPPLRARYAGFASGCRLVIESAELSGGCPASCPDAHQPTRDHRHVRNWAMGRYDHLPPTTSPFSGFFTLFAQRICGSAVLRASESPGTAMIVTYS